MDQQKYMEADRLKEKYQDKDKQHKIRRSQDQIDGKYTTEIKTKQSRKVKGVRKGKMKWMAEKSKLHRKQRKTEDRRSCTTP